ncbi:MAG: hypothetical protein Q7T59_05870 [Candidatus Woesebacteria bacterium]|nr:hypothetical protein [Candidatus Woesebacteria bacterium]
MGKHTKIIYFALTFVVVAVIDVVIFGSLGSRILVGKLEWVLNNTILLLLIFFWLFIAFPSIVAYYVAFVLRKNKIKEIVEKQGGVVEKTQIKTAIIATVVLGIVMTIIIRWVTTPRFLPYTFHSISENEFNRPSPTPIETESQLKILLSKNIDGNDYLLTDGDTKMVYLYKGQKDKRKVWEQDLPIDENRINDFWFDESSNKFFAIEGRGASIGGDTYEEIEQFTLSDNEVLKKTIALFKPGVYSGTRILKYYKEKGILLLVTNGGDGCGGGGKIWFTGDSFKQTILEFGEGCVSPDKPRYVGFTNNLLVLTENDKASNDDLENISILKMYTINPLTLERVNLIDESEFPEKMMFARVSDEDTNILILTSLSEATYEFNINKGIIEKIQSNSQNPK